MTADERAKVIATNWNLGEDAEVAIRNHIEQAVQAGARTFPWTAEKMEKPSAKTAEQIVNNWIENQLRPEGRRGIYIDDEAALIIDIANAIEAEREACSEIAGRAGKKFSEDLDASKQDSQTYEFFSGCKVASSQIRAAIRARARK